MLTVNALVAAAEVLIPIQCEYYALEGLEQLLRTVDLVKSHLNPDLAVSTILLTMFDGRTRLASQVADEVREHFGEVVLESITPVLPRPILISRCAPSKRPASRRSPTPPSTPNPIPRRSFGSVLQKATPHWIAGSNGSQPRVSFFFESSSLEKGE